MGQLSWSSQDCPIDQKQLFFLEKEILGDAGHHFVIYSYIHTADNTTDRF